MGRARPPPFFQLDPFERLPREKALDRGPGGLQLQGTERWRKLNRGELGAGVVTPSLFLRGSGPVQTGAPLPVAVIAIALLILALVVFGFSGRRPQRLS